MQRHRLPFPFAMLLLTFAIADAAAQAPRPPGQPGQQGQAGQQAQPAQQAAQFQQPVGQPLLVVPQPTAQAPAGPRVNPDLPTVELAPLLERVERAANKQFLLDGRVGPQIYLAGVEPNDVTYPMLLSILRANGFAAFESEGRVNIVPEAEIRFHAPVVQADDASIPADLIVTRVLTAANIEVVYLVPMLRPLLPQSAHLAAHMNSNRLLIM